MVVRIATLPELSVPGVVSGEPIVVSGKASVDSTAGAAAIGRAIGEPRQRGRWDCVWRASHPCSVPDDVGVSPCVDWADGTGVTPDAVPELLVADSVWH